MTSFELMGFLSTIALAIPVILLAVFKLGWYKNLTALFVYFIFVLVYNIFSLGYIRIDASVLHGHAILNNFLDVPLTLLFLAYFSNTASLKKAIVISAIGFVAFELVTFLVFGFGKKSTNIILGPGLLMLLVLCVVFFIQQVKVTVVHHKAIGRLLMISSTLFAYVGYSFLYLAFSVMAKLTMGDASLLFFLITIFSSITMGVGIFMEAKEVRQLKEMETTREELKALYGEEEETKTIAPLETIVFQFDKNTWN